MSSSAENWPVRNQIRRILPPPAKEWVANLICHPLIGKAVGVMLRNQIPSGRFSIQTSAPTVSPRSKAEIFWGVYESAEIRMIHQHLRNDLDLLEVGASLGVVSSHAIGCLAADARIVCVEANPDLLPVLSANLEANHPDRKVVVLNRAIDYLNAPGTTQFQLSENTAGSKLGRLDTADSSSARRVEVPASTISALVQETELRDFAMISDIEGAEAGFILSKAKELDGCRQILIELHDTEHQGREVRWGELLEELQRQHGFRVMDGHGPVHTLER